MWNVFCSTVKFSFWACVHSVLNNLNVIIIISNAFHNVALNVLMYFLCINENRMRLIITLLIKDLGNPLKQP